MTQTEAGFRLDVRAFEAVPAWVGLSLRTHIDRAADDLLAELWQDRARLGEDEAARVRAGIAAGLRNFCDLVEDPGAGWERVTAFYLGIGGQLARDGRDPMEAHQVLHRSVLAAWRTITAMTDSLDLDRPTLSLVVNAQFGYMDALTEVIAEGYRAELRTRADGFADPAAGRRRARLLHLLLADPPASPAEVAAVAAEARWPLPGTVAAAVAAPRRDEVARGPLPTSEGLLTDFGAPEPCLLIPDPDGRDASGPGASGRTVNGPGVDGPGLDGPGLDGPGLDGRDGARGLDLDDLDLGGRRGADGGRAWRGRMRLPEPLLRDWIVAVGPTVPLPRAAESLRWARETLALARRGVIPDAGVIRSAEHVPTLVIARAEELIDDAAATRLAPLSLVPPARRERLAETLLALLEHNFNAADASRRLRVHPQTVRYRLRHLEDLFGDDLRDPARCLEMELILHARTVNRATRR